MTPSSAAAQGAVLPVRIVIFGGMRLFHFGSEVEIGPPRQRAILALLVASRGAVVTIDEVVDSLWTENPPASAVNQIHRHIGELRRLLEPGLEPRSAGSLIHATGHGYRLDATRLQSDLGEFDTYSRASTDPAHGAMTKVTIARQPSFIDLPWEVRSAPAFLAIERDRLAAVLALTTLDTNDESLEAAVSLVEPIVAEAPLDEALQAGLMKLLVRTGRRAQALEVYERTRSTLSEQLGIDPGPLLRDAHLEALGGNSAQAKTASAPSTQEIPRSLPNRIPTFVDRRGLLPVLDDVIEQAVGSQGATAVLSGMGGVGKTTLAIQWAHNVSERFADGELYVNMRGFDPDGKALSAEDGINRLLEQLGSDALGESPGARHDQYRQLIAGKRILLLIDNAADPDQVRPLLPGSAGCLTIVTSRNELAGLIVREAARSIPLRRWNADESRELLVTRLGLVKVEEAPAAIESIIESCAGLPLALAIASARSALQPDWPISSMARELAMGGRRLDSLVATGDYDVRTTFDWSYSSLSPEVARLFRHLAAHPGAQMSVTSLATCIERPLAQTRSMIRELVAANMAAEVEPGTVELHDLLRAYAGELLDTSGERLQAERRLLEHYVRSTREAFLQFGRPPAVDLGLPDSTADSIDKFSDMYDSIAWYSRERDALVASIRFAVRSGFDRQAALLALDWRPMNQTLDSASNSIDICRMAYEAAVRSGDQPLMADLARDVGSKLTRLGEFDEGKRLILEALHSFEAIGDSTGEANTYRNLSQNAGRAYDKALEIEYARLGVEAARRSERPEILALSLAEYSHVLPMLGEPNLHEQTQLEALELAEASGLDYLVPQIRANLATNAMERGNVELARKWALSVDTGPGTDPGLRFDLAAIRALSAIRLNLVDDVRWAVREVDELLALHSALLMEDPENISMYVRYADEARAWLLSAEAADPSVSGEEPL